MFEGKDDVDVAAPGKPQALFQRALVALDRKLCTFYGRASAVGDREFFDAQDFPWINAIEADWRKVHAELDALLPYAAHLPNFQDISDIAGGLPRRRLEDILASAHAARA
jgi:aspartyl/asparaginyl beta-hydroxylase (cupin superfamily)